MYKKIKQIKITLFAVMIISIFIVPMTAYAVPTAEDTNNPNSLQRPSDSEIGKSGSQIRDEINFDSEELDVHGVREIGNKKNSFYKAYKDEFDEWADNVPGAAIYVKLIKKYHYKDGEFVCGKFDVLCHIVNFGFVTGSSIVNALLSPISKLAISPEDILLDTSLSKFKLAFSTFTTSLLAVFILFQIMKIYAFRMTNHSDTVSVLNEKIIKIIMACVFLFSYDLFFRAILNIQYRVNYGIFNYISNSHEVTQNIMLSMLLTPNGIIFVILILLFAILLAVLFFQMLYTFAMISVFYVVGPIAITTMVNDEYNMFSNWLKTIISRFLTLGLQGLCVILCLSFGSRLSFVTESANMTQVLLDKIYAIAFLVVGIALPALLKEFGNSSGTGKAVTSGARTIGTMFMRR